MNLLMTGGTGFLGKNLLELLKREYKKIYVLTRVLPSKPVVGNIIYLKGDLTGPDIFEVEKLENEEKLSSEIFNEEDAFDILHAGAYYKIDATWEDAYLNNVLGTQNIIFLAKKLKNVRHFHYISTIAVAGDYKGVFYEDMLDYNQQFSSHYSKSKYLAEKYVRDSKKDLLQHCKVSIYRPGIIVGDSKSGEIEKIDGPYYLYELLRKIRFFKKYLRYIPFWALPYSRQSHLPIIPVDHVAEKICFLMKESTSLKYTTKIKTRCYHILSEELPRVEEMLCLALEAMEIKAPLVPLPKTNLESHLLRVLNVPLEIATYFFNECFYERRNTQSLIGFPQSKFSNYKQIFIDYIKGLN